MDDPVSLVASDAESKAMLRSMHNLRSNERFCDFKFQSDDGVTFAVHSVVVAAASEALGALFNENFIEGRSKTIGVKTSANALQVVLDYIYGRDTVAHRQSLVAVFKFAHMYGLCALEQKVVAALHDGLHVQSALQLLTECRPLLSIDLEERCHTYLAEHFEEACKIDAFVHLPASEIGVLLRHDAFSVTREETLVDALFKWYWARNACEDNVESVMSLLLQNVRYVLLAEASLRKLQEVAQSLGPCGVNLHKDVRKALRLHSNLGTQGSSQVRKRHKKQNWWPEFGASISGGIEYMGTLPIMGRTIAAQGQDLLLCGTEGPNSNKVWRLSPGATECVIVAGEGAPINGPNDLGNRLHAISDSAGKGILVCDFQNKRVLRISDGTSTVIGEGLWDLDYPCAVRSTPDGAIFVLDQSGNRVQKLYNNRVEVVCTTVGNKHSMGGLWVTNAGHIFLSHVNSKQLLRFEAGGSTSTVVVDSHLLKSIGGFWVSDDETVYIADFIGNKIVKFPNQISVSDSVGLIIADGRCREKNVVQLDTPIGVTFDSNGALYVLEKDRISKFGPPPDLSIGRASGQV